MNCILYCNSTCIGAHSPSQAIHSEIFYQNLLLIKLKGAGDKWPPLCSHNYNLEKIIKLIWPINASLITFYMIPIFTLF